MIVDSNNPCRIRKVNPGKRIFVSRHPGAIEWARRHHWGQGIQYVSHLVVSTIFAGDVVIGTLPINMVAALCARGAYYFHLSLALTSDQRGTELSADELVKAGAHLVPYRVEKSVFPTVPKWYPDRHEHAA